jgi:hypothetical protein
VLWFKTTIGKIGFECTQEKFKEYTMELATYLSLSEALIFPNNIDPLRTFEMFSLNFGKLKGRYVRTAIKSKCGVN